MPYINIIIPRERVYLSGTNFFDTLDEYIIGFKDDTFAFNENILNFEEKEKRGLVNGRLFWLNNYSYNDFNQSLDGCTCLTTGIDISGYSTFTGPITNCVWKVNYLYDNFNIYNTGTISSLAFGYSIFSGYSQFTGLTTGTTF